MIEVIGKEGIIARVICDSIGGTNMKRMSTFELEYPRFIHSEVMTHKMLSKNSASSRAIPVKTILDQIRNNPAMPVWWGKNQPGMSAREELTGEERDRAEFLWRHAANTFATLSEDILNEVGLHKQLTNRLTESFQRMKTVISGTEWKNLWWLRDHSDAQPEFHELARVMREAYEESVPTLLAAGEWHLPYVERLWTYEGGQDILTYQDENDNEVSLEEAQRISSSCCAQVSYRKNDGSLEKADDIFAKLIGMDRKHASPFEHQATPIYQENYTHAPMWDDGITHMRKDGMLCSGNLFGWIQYRQLIPGHTVW